MAKLESPPAIQTERTVWVHESGRGWPLAVYQEVGSLEVARAPQGTEDGICVSGGKLWGSQYRAEQGVRWHKAETYKEGRTSLRGCNYQGVVFHVSWQRVMAPRSSVQGYATLGLFQLGP